MQACLPIAMPVVSCTVRCISPLFAAWMSRLQHRFGCVPQATSNGVARQAAPAARPPVEQAETPRDVVFVSSEACT